MKQHMQERMGNLSGADLEVDFGEALEVFLEEPLGVVLSDLLPSHCRALARERERRLNKCQALLERERVK